ncbi:MAG: Mrp/NBP35 family ATP-binding protein [candidate division Zixibacteria bacterium]|nr:Mrp/NBP35 family ATP-binding protein [candidate division Zixibacteria bacterium]MDH3936609.1 Mrp/NBP35 family ATP-binding protein [candidate division Zixibacteria bacterium]MDH4032578.1 Mrp/NBP35 family ATP-binding protein [candidate division Zixibacteria bacterium]
MLTETAVREVLDKIDDPELKKPLTDLDMIRSIDIQGGDVTVGVSLTVPGCPMKEKISRDITTGVGALSGAESVRVEFDVMTDEQRKNLRQKLGFSDSAQAKGPAPVSYAKRFIAVSSGKGGVGKSTVTTNVAVAMAGLGYKVGLLDADVYGFSIPHMLGVEGRPTMIDDQIIPLRKGDNIQVVSMGLFISEDEPVVWRGPLLHKAINQFIRDVVWDELDYLFLDLPPGTGDVSLTIAQAIPSAEMLVVTTPQATATHVAGRVAKMAEKTDLRVLGVIENMAYFETNGEREYIFGRDGGKNLAKKLSVPFLGEIPLMTSLREGSDSGKPVASDGTPDQVKLFESIAQLIDGTAGR